MTRRSVPIVLVSSFVLAACGGEPSVASRSHAAYREAIARGETVSGGHEHGGHQAAVPGDAEHHDESSTAAVHDEAHASMPRMPAEEHPADPDAGAHASMDHGATAGGGGAGGHSGHAPAGGASSAHQGHATAAASSPAHTGHAAPGTASTSGHEAHSARPATEPPAHAAHDAPPAAAPSGHAAHQPAAPDSPAGHEMHVTATRAAEPPRASREIGSVTPSATLTPDPLDAPAPTAVAEAEKAARAAEEGHAGHEASEPAAPPDHTGHATRPPRKD